MIEGTAIIIDDDPFFCNMMTDLLEEFSLKVASYSSPEALFSELDTDGSPSTLRCPDFILTDNQMPGMTGLDFLIQIKAMGCTLPDHRIAIISGRWDDIDMEKAKSLGCQIFDKYNSPEKIHAWIKEAQQHS
jgi:CheY-like chemotaxis protein